MTAGTIRDACPFLLSKPFAMLLFLLLLASIPYIYIYIYIYIAHVPLTEHTMTVSCTAQLSKINNPLIIIIYWGEYFYDNHLDNILSGVVRLDEVEIFTANLLILRS